MEKPFNNVDDEDLNALDRKLRDMGEQPVSSDQLIQLYEDGYRIYVFHEMDMKPMLAEDLEIILKVPPDLTLSLPPDEKLESLRSVTSVMTSDGYRFHRQPDGSWSDVGGDMSYENLDVLYEECEGEVQPIPPLA